MATEKQVNYIKTLIRERRPENMAWWNKPVKGVDEADRERGRRYADHSKVEWIMSVFDLNRYEHKISIDEAVRLYNALIAYYENMDLVALTSAEASQLIDDLKRMRYGRGKLELVQ